MSDTSLLFSVVQIFNRRSIGYLWDKKAELDPGQVSIINSIYNNKKKGGSIGSAEQKITYKLSGKAAGKLGYGRLYGTKGSFETLEKECRGTICKEYYHDIDIVNCHPVLLLQFAKSKYGADLPEVEKYVIHRESYLKNVMTENAVTRDEAKQAIISVLYGGSCNQKSYLYELSLEVRGFSKKLFSCPEYADLAKVCKGEDNVYGTFMAFVLQTEERHCMIAMKEHLEAQGWSVDVLCYDGVMIRKREGHAPDLMSCELAIMDKTGYAINLISKEFASFDMPSVSEEVAKGVSLEKYQAMKEEFEQMNFYHGPSDKYVKVYPCGDMIFMGVEHARELWKTEWYFKHSDKFADYTSLFDIWRQDANRKVCSKFSFKNSDRSDVFVIPINFAYLSKHSNGSDIAPENLPITPLELFLELVDINTSGDPLLKEYVLNYFAHMLQLPTELPGVGLVITGSKGVGKDTLGDFLQEYVIGRSLSTNYVTNNQFFEKHDQGKLNKFLIKLEETSKRDCLDNAEALKAFITAPQMTANPKGVREVTADNFARFIFTTNKANPVDLSDKERRFVLLRCSNRKKSDFAFWKQVRSILFTHYGGKEIASYLLSRDLTNFQIRELPQNDYQESVIKTEQTSEEKFIDAWEGELTALSELYELYKTYCITNSMPYKADANTFAKQIMTLVRDNVLIQTRNGNISNYQKAIKPRA